MPRNRDRYAKVGRPKGMNNHDYERVTTRANDLDGRCPGCHLLLDGLDCAAAGRCMARLSPFDQLEPIRRLVFAMNQDAERTVADTARRALYEATRRVR